MTRPRTGEKGCEEANKKWRATMLARYGGEAGLHEKMVQMGRLGGQNGHTGGFAANPALARIAGAKGGSISRRGPAKKAGDNND